MREAGLRDVLRTIATEYGTPCYVYFLHLIRSRAAELRRAFDGRFQISFAVKSNPSVRLLRHLRESVELLDISSAGEIQKALAAGWGPERLSFTGPGKTEAELRLAVEIGIGEVVLESVDEAETLHCITAEYGRTQPVLVRIAPRTVPRGFGLHMSGKPTAFGIDEENADAALQAILSLSGLTLRGLHIYSGTQCLKAEAIIENYSIFAEIFRRLSRAHNLELSKLVFGAGLGIPYHDGELPVDLASVGAATVPLLDELRREPGLNGAAFVLETGRFLVGEAGVYVTRVVRIKESRGTLFCICDGGMNHHLAAAGHLGTVVQRNYPIFAIPQEERAGSEEFAYNIVGPLCTTMDTLGRQVKLPLLQPGDLIAIGCSGAYGLTASPVYFISHPLPREFVVDSDGCGYRFETEDPLSVSVCESRLAGGAR